MDHADQWPLGLDHVVKPMEAAKGVGIERKPRPQKEQALNCPRCNSTNTKFCYYNNYNLSQPRYFCKTCRRYWTEGGTLRNVPVGGGSRKNKRSSSSSSSSSSSCASVLKKLPDLISSSTAVAATNTTAIAAITTSQSQNPKIHGGQDLNLAFDRNLHVISDHRVYNNTSSARFEFDQNPNLINMPSPLELFKEGGSVNVSSRGLSFLGSMNLSDNNNNNNIINNPSFISAHSNDYFKPMFNFCLDGQLEHIGSTYGNSIIMQQPAAGIQETGSTRTFHQYDDSKNFTSSINDNQYHEQQNKGQGESSGGCWSGMLGGGGSW